MNFTSDQRGGTGSLPFDALDAPAEVIERGLAWARSHGHPYYPWPDIPVPAWRSSLRAVARTTAGVLGNAPRPVALDVPAGATPASMGIAAFTAAMGPLLGYWIESGNVRTDPPVAALLALHLAHNRRRDATLRGEMLRLLRRFRQEGIAVVALKGAHTAIDYFPDPATRPLADLDLAVNTAAFEDASRVLHTAGFVPGKRQRRPKKETWIRPPAVPVRSLALTHAENPWAVEIHASLDRDFHGVRTVRLGPLDETATAPWDAFGEPARVLAQPVLLGYLALHASEEFHHLPLVRLVELVLVARADHTAGRLDWDELRALLDKRHGRRFAYPALALAERLAPGTIDRGLLQSLAADATAAMRRVVDPLEPGDAQRLDRISMDERFMWARGPAQWLRRLARFVVPWGTDVPLGQLGVLHRERVRRLIKGRVSMREP